MSTASCLAVLFATYSWSRGQSANRAESVMYAILHRTVWAAGVAWVLFVCATGHGGQYINYINLTKKSVFKYSFLLCHAAGSSY